MCCGDLDINLISDLYNGPYQRTEKRAFYIIKYAQKNIDNNRAYENFIHLLDKWESESNPPTKSLTTRDKLDEDITNGHRSHILIVSKQNNPPTKSLTTQNKW